MRDETLNWLEGVVSDLESLARQVREDTRDSLATGDPIEVIKHYNHLRLAMARIKTAREALSELEEALSRDDIPTLFTNRSVKSMNVEGVGRVTVSHRFSASIIDKQGYDNPKQEGHDWLENKGLGSLIKPTVNASALAAAAKEYMVEKGLDFPSDIFKVGTSPYTSITKA